MIDFINALSKSLQGKHTKESLRRSQICGECPEKSKSILAVFVDASLKEVEGYQCDRCKCPIGTKVFAEEKQNICSKWL